MKQWANQLKPQFKRVGRNRRLYQNSHRVRNAIGTEKRIAVSGKGSEFEAIVEFANGLKIKANNRASRELWNDLV